MQLKDAQLFRQQAYIDGQWLDADSGQTIAVNNPATGEIIGHVPKMGARNPPCRRGRREGAAGLACADCQSPTAHREAETAKAHRG